MSEISLTGDSIQFTGDTHFLTGDMTSITLIASGSLLIETDMRNVLAVEDESRHLIVPYSE